MHLTYIIFVIVGLVRGTTKGSCACPANTCSVMGIWVSGEAGVQFPPGIVLYFLFLKYMLIFYKYIQILIG